MRKALKAIIGIIIVVAGTPALLVWLTPVHTVTWIDGFPTEDFSASGRVIEGALTHKDGAVVSWDVAVGRSLAEQKLIADVVVVSGEQEAIANVAINDKELFVTNLVGSFDARVLGGMAPPGSPYCDGIVEASVASFTFSQAAMSGDGSLSSENLDCRVGGFIPLVLEKVTANLEEQSDAHNGRVTVTAGNALLLEAVHADVGLLRTTLYTAIKQGFPLFLSDTDVVLDTRYQVFP